MSIKNEKRTKRHCLKTVSLLLFADRTVFDPSVKCGACVSQAVLLFYVNFASVAGRRINVFVSDAIFDEVMRSTVMVHRAKTWQFLFLVP